MPSFSQKLMDFISYDTMVYVYKLDKEQTNYVVKKNTIEDTSMLFTHLYKTYPRKNYKDDTLPNGNFIVTTINREIINYRYLCRTSFAIKSKVIGEEVIFFLSDKNKKTIIEQAEMEIDGHKISFNNGYGGYSIDAGKIDKEHLRQNKVYVTIRLGDEYQMLVYNFQKTPKQAAPRVDAKLWSGGQSEGYLITDKPVYKPGDTLNLKAFLMDPKNGRRIRGKVHIGISESYQNFSWQKKIKAITPGAFVFKWTIPDTLKIDRNFNINLWYRKHKMSFSKSHNFYLEDYLLNRNNYDVVPLSDQFYAGEDIAFSLSAKDANQFPMQGTQIHYKLIPSQITDFLDDSLTISEAKRLNWYEKDTVYPYENSLLLKIPSAALPNANAIYILEVTFTDPITFERKVIVKQLSKQTQTERILTYQKEDSMFIHCLYNGKDTAHMYRIISLSNQDTLFNKIISTPYAFKLSPYNTRVLFIDKDSVQQSVDVIFNKLNISHIKGKRSADSMQIAFSFPFDEPVYYRIVKGEKLIQSGKTTSLDFKIKDDSKDSYTILFTSNLNGSIENNYYKITYVPNEHQIVLKSSMPEQAFPGQHLPITITATDYKGKPLKGINIAAYGVNKQFEDRLQIPQIVIPDKYKDLISIQTEENIDFAYLTQVYPNQNHVINKHNVSLYHLQKNEYYELRYPEKQLAFLSQKIQSKTPEFTVTVTNKHQLYTPKYILIDGAPIYISDLNSNTYSFPAKVGRHEIAFRYFNKKIILHDIEFKASLKYWLGINIDSVSTFNSAITIIDSLTTAQPTPDEKILLYNTLLITNQFGFDSLRVQPNQEGPNGIFYGSITRPQSLNIDGDAFYVFGPLKANSTVLLKCNKKEFNLSVSRELAHFYDPELKQFTTKTRGPIKGVIFNFYENLIQDYQLSALSKPDTIIPPPQNVPIKFDSKAYEANKKEPQKEYNQNYRSSTTSDYFTIRLKNDGKINYAKAIWIVNLANPDGCDFIPGLPKINNYNYLKYGVSGKYDLYFLMNDDKLIVLRNVYMKPHDEFYVNPSKFSTEKITNEKLATPLKIYSDLTQLPMLPFYFPPEVSSEQIKEIKNLKRSNPYLHGIITDKSLQPIVNAMIMLEVNGKYKEGGYTNTNGEFEILNIPTGSYEIKIYHPDYQLKHYTTRFMQEGNDYELNASLNASATQRPVLETINRDFRFMAFTNKTQHDVLKIQVYDKENREPLRGAVLTIYENDKIVSVKNFENQHEIEIVFPDAKSALYRFEIKREGYIPIQLYNVRFIATMSYTLHLFLAPKEEKNLVQKKEYDLHMTNVNLEDFNPYRGNVYSVVGNSNEVYQYAAPPEMYGSAAGVSTSNKSYVPLSVSGGRALTVNYSVEGTYGFSDVAISSSPTKQRSGIYVGDNMINEVANNADISQSRKNFNDVGYWQPNHITDKQGNIHFDIKLPDNITTWKSTVLAMGKHRLHGFDSSETKVYKPLQTMSMIPQFMWENDNINVKAKFTNLTSDAKKVRIQIMVNDNILRTAEPSVKNDYVDSVLLTPSDMKPIHWKASLFFEDKYKDEEEREIPVYSSAFKLYYNQHFLMEKDSSYSLTFANDTKGKIILNNTLYEKIISEINELNNYEYGCVEQTASKLKALLCKEKINKAMGLKENLTPSIYQLINRLANYQNPYGTWGWWKRQQVNWRMTIYALDVLRSADVMGYSNSNYATAKDAVNANFNYLSVSDKLYALYVLQKMNANVQDIKNLIEQLKPDGLRTIDKIYYYKIKEQEGLTVDPSEFYSLTLEMNNRMQTPYADDFFYDPRSGMFTAYFLFSKSAMAKEWLDVFKAKLSNGQLEKNLNTYAKANMIEALTSSIEATGNKPVTSKIIINDTLTIKTFPYTLPILGTSYKINHSGADVFVNTAEENWTYNPKKSDSLFGVTTSFTQNNQTSTHLKAGIPCQMKVTLNAYRSADYVMLEIPIPSGMHIANKIQQDGGSAEYYKNKIVVFYSKLTMNQHQLAFDFIPNLKGNFTLPAAKCSLMYYPYLYGNNTSTSIEIE